METTAPNRRIALGMWLRTQPNGFEICVADDAPPERFDHINTLIQESVGSDPPPDFLRMVLDDERT